MATLEDLRELPVSDIKKLELRRVMHLARNHIGRKGAGTEGTSWLCRGPLMVSKTQGDCPSLFRTKGTPGRRTVGAETRTVLGNLGQLSPY